MHISVISLNAWVDGGRDTVPVPAKLIFLDDPCPRVQVIRIEEWKTQERSKFESIVDSNACIINVRVHNQSPFTLWLE